MVYLELIRVQSAEAQSGPSKNNIWALVQKELDVLEPNRGRIFFRIEQPGEAMLVVRWDRESFDPRGSRIAQLLVSELKKHGLVNYSAWVEGSELKAVEPDRAPGARREAGSENPALRDKELI